jgi:hypothetical protein
MWIASKTVRQSGNSFKLDKTPSKQFLVKKLNTAYVLQPSAYLHGCLIYLQFNSTYLPVLLKKKSGDDLEFYQQLVSIYTEDDIAYTETSITDFSATRTYIIKSEVIGSELEDIVLFNETDEDIYCTLRFTISNIDTIEDINIFINPTCTSFKLTTGQFISQEVTADYLRTLTFTEDMALTIEQRHSLYTIGAKSSKVAMNRAIPIVKNVTVLEKPVSDIEYTEVAYYSSIYNSIYSYGQLYFYLNFYRDGYLENADFIYLINK